MVGVVGKLKRVVAKTFDKVTDHFHDSNDDEGYYNRDTSRSHQRNRHHSCNLTSSAPQQGPSREDRVREAWSDDVYDSPDRRRTEGSPLSANGNTQTVVHSEPFKLARANTKTKSRDRYSRESDRREYIQEMSPPGTINSPSRSDGTIAQPQRSNKIVKSPRRREGDIERSNCRGLQKKVVVPCSDAAGASNVPSVPPLPEQWASLKRNNAPAQRPLESIPERTHDRSEGIRQRGGGQAASSPNKRAQQTREKEARAHAREEEFRKAQEEGKRKRQVKESERRVAAEAKQRREAEIDKQRRRDTAEKAETERKTREAAEKAEAERRRRETVNMAARQAAFSGRGKAVPSRSNTTPDKAIPPRQSRERTASKNHPSSANVVSNSRDRTLQQRQPERSQSDPIRPGPAPQRPKQVAAPLSEQNIRRRNENFVQNFGVQTVLNRGIGDMTRTVIEGLVPMDETEEGNQTERVPTQTERVIGDTTRTYIFGMVSKTTADETDSARRERERRDEEHRRRQRR